MVKGHRCKMLFRVAEVLFSTTWASPPVGGKCGEEGVGNCGVNRGLRIVESRGFRIVEKRVKNCGKEGVWKMW